jgi:tetratricopeptide (TPR) repeat protein
MDKRSSLQALERASRVIPDGEEMRDDDVPALFLNNAHSLRWRGSVLAALGEDEAVDDLEKALAGMDESFTRAEAGLRIELANALLSRSKGSEAREQAQRARTLINQLDSLRHRRRLDRLVQRIAQDA